MLHCTIFLDFALAKTICALQQQRGGSALRKGMQ
jgi:hypothetical protein